MLSINFVSVFVAAVTAFVIGFLAHGPLFGKLWMRLADIHPTGNEKFKDMIPQMLFNLLANMVTAYVIAMMYLFVMTSFLTSGSAVWNGVVCAFWLWLGFNATATSIDVIWMGKSYKLWLYELACSLVVFLSMGAIVAGF